MKKKHKTDIYKKKRSDQNLSEEVSSLSNSFETKETIYGKHAVHAYLETGKQANKLFVQIGIAGEIISSIIKMAKINGIVFQEVPKSKLDEMVEGESHQGVVLTIPPFDYAELEDALQLAASRGEDPFILILDGIVDPHNLGSILRTADATGVHGVIIPKRRSVGLTNVVAKTSTGAIEYVPVIRVGNIKQVMDQLKERGIWIFATDMSGEDMRQWDSHGPIALVIGNEGQGVSELVKKSADGIVTIPMVGHVQSLNASVASAVLMYEVARHRIGK
ncbi:23S rRNA (guanosine(2251)-2'-O)-methyltransferase RlmB [Facklamia miroungae]|uniref:23S rRNA (Guanosine2251-2'-O)-methyltransferase n=1 Tax=Facklamia miroungae TaxID=120956 RepID=A0A1G7SW47_9LACT|nr:23S rRNA (guanosine(2251)-2'-O)-methyltransferase RlmB [Facklamia miroungae]NKZ29520.1 23S rRNA (guanosine(2251)-2'-O)-methyltransferase RlmB [Facklamia miroungae]SDG27014.1 23S rRNA (guanosine2251-2'-O)-methyltransferase [Facklamia miroungae]